MKPGDFESVVREVEHGQRRVRDPDRRTFEAILSRAQRRRRRMAVTNVFAISVIATLSVVLVRSLIDVRTDAPHDRDDIRPATQYSPPNSPPADYDDPSSCPRDNEIASSGRLAYVKVEKAEYDLYSLDLSSGREWRLTEDPQPQYTPSWSPSGSELLVHGYEGPGSEGEHIYLVAADGSRHSPLITPGGSDPAWDPRGEKIVFVSSRDGHIYVVDSDGSNERRLEVGTQPAWSPDGQWIAFTQGSVIKTMNADGSQVRALTEGAYPAWSPDGSEIGFTRYGEDRGDIYVMSSDGSDVREIVSCPEDEWGPTWSPNGRHIAFVRSKDGVGRLYIADVAGTQTAEVPTGEGSVLDPSFAPVDR